MSEIHSTSLSGTAPGETDCVLAQQRRGNTQPGSQPQALECSCGFWGQWVLTEEQPEQIIL